MANTKNTKSVKLSNEGFADLFENVDVYAVSVYRSRKDKTIKFKIVKEGSNNILPDVDRYKKYVSKFNKVIEGNRIEEKDKVFFSSNSIYPRTAFNRYSNSARRIEKIEKADKIVVGEIPTLYARSYSGFRIKNKLVFMHSISGKQDEIYKTIRDYGEVHPLNCGLTTAFNKEVRGYYGFAYDASRRLENQMEKEFMKQFPKAEKISFGIIDYIPVKFEKTLKILKEGYPLTSFITDTEVSSYIDGYKDVIDEDNYPMLLAALKGDNKQVTLAMKLIENMDTFRSKPYLYALFINAFSKNRRTIINNKYYKSVGFTNVLNTFDIKELVGINDPYSNTNTSRRKLQYIHKVYKKKLRTNEDKTTFMTHVEDTVAHEFEALVGKEVYDLFITHETL